MNAPCGSDLLVKLAGCDATDAFANVGHSSAAHTLLKNFCVGILDVEEVPDNRNDKELWTLAISSALDK